jgi:hypothetical protein
MPHFTYYPIHEVRGNNGELCGPLLDKSHENKKELGILEIFLDWDRRCLVDIARDSWDVINSHKGRRAHQNMCAVSVVRTGL